MPGKVPQSRHSESLSALERKILECYLKENTGLAQIAEAMECEENDEYIVLILQYVKRKLNRAGDKLSELEEQLKAENLQLDW